MQHKLITGLLLCIIFIVLSGCGTAANKDENVFQFKNSYVGDNSAVSAIVQALPTPNGEKLDTIELQTKAEPYGVTLNYIHKEQLDGIEVGADYNHVAIQSSAVLLALVQNADYVTLNYANNQINITKHDMELWLGKPLNTFVSELQLISYMEFYLQDPIKVAQLINS